MSSNQLFELQENFILEDAVDLIHKVRDNSTKITSIQFEWTSCINYETSAICLLLNLCYECKSNNIKVRHSAHEKNVFYSQNIKPLFEPETAEQAQTGMPPNVFVKSVQDESLMESRRMALTAFLEQLPELKDKNAKGVESFFVELYANVCQHSLPETGVTFVELNPAKGYLEIIVSDIGIGIPANIKDAFADYEDRDDADCIQYATQDLVTGESNETNKQRGLGNLKSYVSSLNGLVLIYSGDGIFELKGQTETLYRNEQIHPGTLIQIQLDWSKFENTNAENLAEDITM
jgi:anti-sigma regulatory factor (Ser/Thr protein kinase)